MIQMSVIRNLFKIVDLRLYLFGLDDAAAGAALSAIISGAATATAAGANGIGNSVASKKQFKRTKELMALQQKYNTINAMQSYGMNYMTQQRVNEYNSPKAQMERYIEAGVNPNLVAGGQPISAASFNSAVGTAGLPSAPVEHLSQIDLSSFADYLSRAVDPSQRKIARYNEDVAKATATSALADATIKQFQASKLEEEFEQHLQEMNDKHELTIAELESKRAQKNISEAELQRIDATIDKLRSDIEVNKESISASKARTELSRRQLDNTIEDSELNRDIRRNEAAAQSILNQLAVERAQRKDEMLFGMEEYLVNTLGWAPETASAVRAAFESGDASAVSQALGGAVSMFLPGGKVAKALGWFLTKKK